MTAKQPTAEEARRLWTGNFGRELVKVARSYAMPLYWPKADGTNQLRNGTAFFLDCGKGPFGVTAGHVYDDFANDAGRGTRCQIGSSGLLDLRERLIRRGRKVDLATFRLTREELHRTGAITLTGSVREWPPEPPELGNAIMFAGYPGVDRQLIGPQRIRWGAFTGMSVVSSVNERDVSSVIEHEFDLPIAGLSIPNPGYDLAGMSGAPLLVAVRSDLIGWRLAGVIYECGSAFGDIIKAARADHIRSDGGIED